MQLPQVPVAVLQDRFAPFEIEVSRDPKGRGVALRRERDGKTYRFTPTPDDHMQIRDYALAVARTASRW
jgi:hypothetical protein